MGTVLAAIVNGILVSAVLAALVWLALWAIPRSRLNAATRYAVWWAALAATLMLPVLLWRTTPSPQAARLPDSIPPIRAVRAGMTAPAVDGHETQSTASPNDRWPRISFPNVHADWILKGWIALSFLMLLRLLVSWALLDWRRACAFRTGKDLGAAAAKWLALCEGKRRGVRLVSSSEIAIPIAVGPRHPAILIPEGLLGKLEEDELGQIVMHEAAHLARRDDCALLLQRLVEALFTVHPVVRWITRQLELEREVACDDFVIEATGRARSYAACLTRMAELCGGIRASLAGASAVSDRSHLARRVDRLLDRTRHTGTRLLKARFAVVVAVLIVAVWTAGRSPVLVAFAMPQAPTVPVAVKPPAPRPPVATVAVVSEPAPPPAPQIPPRTTAPEVNVPVEVTDPMNRFVTGLARENFKVFEDGVEQQILGLSNEGVPVSVAIVADISGSMSDALDAERTALAEFLKSARPVDEFALVLYNHDPRLVVSFTSDTGAILAALQDVQPRGGSSMRDAVYLAIHEIRKSRNHRQAIVILSDGVDNSSAHSGAELQATLLETDCQVFVVNLATRPEMRPFMGMQAVLTLSAFDPATVNASNAPMQAGRVAASLRNLYILTYVSSNTAKDGKLRNVQVQLEAPRGLPPLTVRHRTTY